MTTTLNSLVHMTAHLLMTAGADNEVAVSEQVLTELAADLGLDVAFLRYNDHDIRATRLIAQWPVRTFVPDPDPIGVVSFVGADPVFASAEHLKEPLIIRPEPATDEYQHRIEQGTEIPAISMACMPLLSGDITTGTLGFIKYGDREWFDEEVNALQTIATMFAQLQARSVVERRLQFLGTHDDLSGLYNSRALMEHLAVRLQSPASASEKVGALFIDLDRLKSVNDVFGHSTGDQLIVQVSQRLRDTFGESAFLARMGGDEFVVVPNAATNSAEAYLLAEQVRSLLAGGFQLGQSQFNRTVSIGVAIGVAGQDTVKDLLRFADQALLVAKTAGGNMVTEYTEQLASDQSLRNDVELHLRDGIESDALVLHYQPEIDIRTGTILAVEALVRWNHPTRGMLGPDTFISAAEHSNLAAALGRRVLRAACEQLQTWRAAGLAHGVQLRVNVSPVELVTDGFIERVAQVLAEYDIPPTLLCFDVPEHAIVTDAEQSLITLAKLRDLGVGCALDHFGTGYSVLGHLKSLPIDTLKIDRSFVRDLGTNGGDIAIVRSIIALAEAFNLTVVAEGLETAEAASALKKLGCYRAQGFLLSPPMEATAMARLLAQQIIPISF